MPLGGDKSQVQEVCGISMDHDWKPGDYECRRCHADLSAWNDEEDSDD